MDFNDFVSKVVNAKTGQYSMLYGVKVSYDKQHQLAKVSEKRLRSGLSPAPFRRSLSGGATRGLVLWVVQSAEV